MADKLTYLKAVEFDKTSAAFKKQHGNVDALVGKGWIVQPKYDGCYAKFHLHGDGWTASSRTGERLRSCNHIGQQLLDWQKGYVGAGVVVIGEVWHPAEKFPWISGKFRQHGPCEDLVFIAHDVVYYRHYATGYSPMPYHQRTDELVYLNEYTHVRSAEEMTPYAPATSMARDLVAAGGHDGVILRDPNAAWTAGLAKQGQIVKVKPNITLDLLCRALITEVGPKTGRNVYTISVTYNGVLSMVGSGMPHDEAACPKPGQIVEVECMGLTEDGRLREPRFKGIRYDKEQPDG